MNSNIIFPPYLKAGDLIKIVSPASVIKPELVEGARKALCDSGFRVDVAPHALGVCGSYAASIAAREADVADALTDPEVRAVLCSRGGYGCVHLLEGLSRLNLRDDPKWLIGFSDVSALHALMLSQGIACVHGSMAKALALHPAEFAPNKALYDILTGRRMPQLSAPPHHYNQEGEASGRIMGGNLAVIQALAATPFSPFKPGSILFIEDIAEPIYKVERILWQLRLAGILDTLSGLIIGQFTDYRPDSNWNDMYDMINHAVGSRNYPVAYGFPIGHIEENMPIVSGAEARLSVSAQDSCLMLLSPC